MPVDRCLVVNRQGAVYDEIRDFELGDLTWRLGPSHSASFGISAYDPGIGALQLKTREVQFWRDGSCIWWGRLDKARRSGDMVEVAAVGLYDYFRYRHFGPPVSDRVLNPGFEASGSSLTNWAAVNLESATVSTTVRNRGLRAARLAQSATAADAYLTQTYTETNTSPPGGTVGFTLSGWCWIESFVEAALYERGLYAVSYVQSELPVVRDELWEPLTFSTPRSRWVRLELNRQIQAPTGMTFKIDERLYCPNGVAYWDDIFLGPTTFIGSDQFVDLNTIIANVVGHALGKDNALNITYNGVATGVTGARLYEIASHGNIAAALDEFAETEIAEFDIGWNAAANARTFDLYAPRKGSFKPQYALEDGHGGRVTSVDGWQEGATQTISSPRVLGQGEGVDREYAQATDTSLTDGVIFESVRSAPQEVPLSGIDALAAQDLARQRRPVRTGTLHCSADGLIGNVVHGDTVPVRLREGWPTVDETMRVSSLSLDGDNNLAVGVVTP